MFPALPAHLRASGPSFQAFFCCSLPSFYLWDQLGLGTDVSPSEPKPGSFPQLYLPSVMGALPSRTARPCAVSWTPDATAFQGGPCADHCLPFLLWPWGPYGSTLKWSPPLSSQTVSRALRLSVIQLHMSSGQLLSPSAPCEWVFLSQIPV